MVSRMVILFSTKCFLFVYMFIDPLKLKAYKVFENSDADLSGFFFKEANLYKHILVQYIGESVTHIYKDIWFNTLLEWCHTQESPFNTLLK